MADAEDEAAAQAPVRASPKTTTNRYSSLAGAGEVDNWLSTFNKFDRDGAGDINHHEIGLLFLQLGFRPTDAEIRALVSEVDNDSSGTVDFEEFCLLMLRLKRQPHIPDWLRGFFFPKEGEVAPEVVVLSQAHKRDGAEGEAGQCPPLSRDMFFFVTDLLPLCDTLLTLKLSGYGDAFGPFLAEELAIGLGRSNRTLKTLELAYNAIGDVGAEAFARALEQNFVLSSLDLAGNGIGVKSAQALLDSIPAPPLPAPPATDKRNRGASRKPSNKSKAAKPPQGSSLRALNLEGNHLPPTLLADVATRLGLLELPRTFAQQLEAPPPPPAAPAAARAALAAVTLSGLAADATPSSVSPAVTVSEPALCAAHTAALHAHAIHHGLASLALVDCGAMGEAGGKALFLASGDGAAAADPGAFKAAKASVLMKPPPAMLHAQLRQLRISACGLGDEAASALADFVRCGCVPALASLALDGNRITLRREPAASAPLPPRLSLGQEQEGEAQLSLKLAEALLALPHLTDVDLSANPLADADAALLCRALLSSATLELLHLAGTYAGDASAAACAAALDGGARARKGGAPSQLRALSLSGEVGDAGAALLAKALPTCAALRELWLGGAITDEGAARIAAGLREPTSRLRSLALGGTTRGGVAIRNPRLTARAAEAFAETLSRPDGSLEVLRLSGNAGIGGGGCVRLLSSLQASSSLRALHVDGCGLNKEEVRLLIEALQASVWCLHELRIEHDMPGTLAAGTSPRSPRDAAGVQSGGATPRTPRGGKPVLQRDGKRLLSLQHRLLLAKVLEDNRVLGRRRVESFKLGRSLEEVAHVFNTYCANISQASVDAGLDAWRGVDCAQFVRNVGLPQYVATFERNLSGAKLQWLQMSQMAQLGVASFAHQKEVMKAVRLLVHAYARKEQVDRTMGQWDIVLGRKQAKKDWRRQQTQQAAREAARLRADGAAVRRAERAQPPPRATEPLDGVAPPHVPPPPERSPPLVPVAGVRAEAARAGTSPEGARGPQHAMQHASAPAIVSMPRAPASALPALPALPAIPNKKAARDWVGFLSPFAGNFRSI